MILPVQLHDPADTDTFIRALECFVHDPEPGPALVWTERLAEWDRARLRIDLSVVLSEPLLTGEPVDGTSSC